MTKNQTNGRQLLQSGEVQVLEAPTYLVKFRDAEGKAQVKVAIVVGDDVRFIDNKALSRPAADWLRDRVFEATGTQKLQGGEEAETKISGEEDDAPRLDNQV